VITEVVIEFLSDVASCCVASGTTAEMRSGVCVVEDCCVRIEDEVSLVGSWVGVGIKTCCWRRDERREVWSRANWKGALEGRHDERKEMWLLCFCNSATVPLVIRKSWTRQVDVNVLIMLDESATRSANLYEHDQRMLPLSCFASILTIRANGFPYCLKRPIRDILTVLDAQTTSFGSSESCRLKHGAFLRMSKRCIIGNCVKT
jgi:hypothetical protein